MDLLNIEAPVPEFSETILAQIESSKRANSPRIATLFTNREGFLAEIDQYEKRPAKADWKPPGLGDDASLLFDVFVPETEEVLRINKEKAKNFFGTVDVPGSETILDFIRNNGYADLIAKAENVGTETKDGVGLVARNRRGVELSYSKVTNEGALRKQWEINEQEFGLQIRQKVETIKQVIKWRAMKMGYKID